MSTPDDELIAYLEPDQLVLDKSRPVPRAQLSRRATAALASCASLNMCVLPGTIGP